MLVQHMAHGYPADLDVYPSEVPLVCNKVRVPGSGATTMSQLECTKLPFLTLKKSEVDLHIQIYCKQTLPQMGGNINRHACVLLISRYSSIMSRIELHHTFREDEPKLWWNLTSYSWCLWSIHSRATPATESLQSGTPPESPRVYESKVDWPVIFWPVEHISRYYFGLLPKSQRRGTIRNARFQRS